jgi:hypothetical protein
MAVPHVGHIVVSVQVRASTGIEQPDALAAHQVERGIVEQLVRRSQKPLAASDQIAGGHRRPRLAGGGSRIARVPGEAEVASITKARPNGLPIDAVEMLEHIRGVRFLTAEVVAILRVFLRPPRRDDRDRHEASRDEIEQEVDLLHLERCDRVIARDDVTSRFDRVGVAGEMA